MKTKNNTLIRKGSFFTDTFNKCKTNFVITTGAIASSLVLNTVMTQAEESGPSNTGSIDKFIVFACDWLFKIGGVVGLVGAVMFALGWQREDADGKSRGLMCVMSGMMIMAISQSKNLFGL